VTTTIVDVMAVLASLSVLATAVGAAPVSGGPTFIKLVRNAWSYYEREAVVEVGWQQARNQASQAVMRREVHPEPLRGVCYRVGSAIARPAASYLLVLRCGGDLQRPWTVHRW
jgi:hypothetical protein